MKKLLRITLLILLLASPTFSQASIKEDFAEIKKRSDEVVKNCASQEEKILELSHYVHEKIKPNSNKNITTNMKISTIDRLDLGVGWCNHQVAAFMRLAEAQGIPTRMIYLLNNEGTTSPHTIGEAFVCGRWIVVDPLLDFNFIATRHDIVKTPSLLDGKLPDEKWRDYFINPGVIAYEFPADGRPKE